MSELGYVKQMRNVTIFNMVHTHTDTFSWALVGPLPAQACVVCVTGNNNVITI